MLTRFLALICVVLVCTLFIAAQATAHREGPKGLEGWLVLGALDSSKPDEAMPLELVVAQHGNVLYHFCDFCSGTAHKRSSGPLYWNLIFMADGKRFAYRSGSLHFNESCTLIDIRTGRRLAYYDCYRDPQSVHRPGWVTELRNASELR